MAKLSVPGEGPCLDLCTMLSSETNNINNINNNNSPKAVWCADTAAMLARRRRKGTLEVNPVYCAWLWQCECALVSCRSRHLSIRQRTYPRLLNHHLVTCPGPKWTSASWHKPKTDKTYSFVVPMVTYGGCCMLNKVVMAPVILT